MNIRKTHVLCAVSAIAMAAGMATSASAQSNADLMAELKRMQARMSQLEAQVAAAEARANEATATAAKAQQTAETNAATVASAGAGETTLSSLVSSGDTGARLSISGQVNRAAMFYDDGNDADVRFVDNDNSSTRIRLIAEGDVDEDLTIGSNIEVQFRSNSSADIQQKDGGSVIKNNSFTERKLEVYFVSDTYGKLSLGQGDTASNST